METVLARITGRDRPGITAALLAELANVDAELYDVEQVTTRDRLALDILIGLPDAGRETDSVVKELLFVAWEHGLHIEFEQVDAAEPPQAGPRHAVTVIGQPLTADALARVAGAIAGAGTNIDRITRLSRYPVTCFELVVSGGDQDGLRAGLLGAAAEHGLDVAVQREGLERRAKRLVVLDVDSTLVQDEVIDLLADEAGRLEEARAITQAAMEGRVDFEAALRERVALLAGLDAGVVERVWERLQLTPGARTFVRTLKRLGYRVALVSGGFTVVTDRLRDELGIDHAHANVLEIRDGTLTGRIVGEIVDRARKAEILERIAAIEEIPLSQTVAIGDGANDLDMLARAGLGIAFNARPVVRDAADATLSVPYLDAVLFVLGIRRSDVEEADARDPALPPLEPPIPVPGTPPV